MQEAKLRRRRRSLLSVLMVAVGVMSAGCASTRGSHALVSAAEPLSALDRYSDLIITVGTKTGLEIGEAAPARIRSLIARHVALEHPNRFALDSPRAAEVGVEVAVVITRYDEGNAGARYLLAGLGAMHIDADVAIMDAGTKRTLAQYEVTKTFAWGGTYGVATTIYDIEDAFSAAVAATLGER